MAFKPISVLTITRITVCIGTLLRATQSIYFLTTTRTWQTRVLWEPRWLHTTKLRQVLAMLVAVKNPESEAAPYMKSASWFRHIKSKAACSSWLWPHRRTAKVNQTWPCLYATGRRRSWMSVWQSPKNWAPQRSSYAWRRAEWKSCRRCVVRSAHQDAMASTTRQPSPLWNGTKFPLPRLLKPSTMPWNWEEGSTGIFTFMALQIPGRLLFSRPSRSYTRSFPIRRLAHLHG